MNSRLIRSFGEFWRVLFPRRAAGLLERWFSYVSAVAIVIVGLWIIVSVTTRWLGTGMVGGAEEAAALLMVVIVMLSVPTAQALEKHIAVNSLVSALPKRWQALCRMIALVVGAVISVLLAWQSFPPAVESFNIRHTIGVFVQLPVWPALFAVPIGAALLALRLIMQIIWQVGDIRQLSKLKPEKEKQAAPETWF